MLVTVANVKGGVGKTMTSVHLAAELAARAPTLLVDADPEASALEWIDSIEDGEAAVPVVGLPVRNLVRRLAEIAGGYSHMVIDTPPGDRAIIRGAMSAADIVVVPLAPTQSDVRRLRRTIELAREEVDDEVRIAVLLTRVRPRTVLARQVRSVLADELGLWVLRAEVPLAEALANADGAPVTAGDGPYARVARELLEAM